MSSSEGPTNHEEGNRPVETSEESPKTAEPAQISTEGPGEPSKQSDAPPADTQSPPPPTDTDSSKTDPKKTSDESSNIQEPAESKSEEVGEAPPKPEQLVLKAQSESSQPLTSDPADSLATETDKLNLADTIVSSAPKQASNQDASAAPPPPPPPKDDKFLNADGTPAALSPAKSTFSQDGKNPMDRRPSDAYLNEKDFGGESSTDGNDNPESKLEIQNIMGQFDEGKGGAGMEEIMSPRMEFAGPAKGSQVTHPPRRSSLVDPIASGVSPTAPPESSTSPQTPPRKVLTSPPPRTSSLQNSGPPESSESAVDPEKGTDSPARPPSIIFKPPPLEPDPEPDLPFDFHRFLEQLRHRTADPVAKYLRSFLLEFGKKQWMVHEQVKIISDFLEFIAKKMAQCEVWQTVSDAEFDNAREGMEKLVMNRLYNQTFSPAIPPPEPLPAKGSRRKAAQQQMGPGRRGQHQEDVERDDVLAQKVRIYGWVREEHLDIKPLGDKGRKFLNLAQQGKFYNYKARCVAITIADHYAELLKIKSYRAPRDKVICVLNCCKVIFGL
jgi:Rab5 GDP/GTP exchange factor